MVNVYHFLFYLIIFYCVYLFSCITFHLFSIIISELSYSSMFVMSIETEKSVNEQVGAVLLYHIYGMDIKNKIL